MMSAHDSEWFDTLAHPPLDHSSSSSSIPFFTGLVPVIVSRCQRNKREALWEINCIHDSAVLTNARNAGKIGVRPQCWISANDCSSSFIWSDTVCPSKLLHLARGNHTSHLPLNRLMMVLKRRRHTPPFPSFINGPFMRFLLRSVRPRLEATFMLYLSKRLASFNHLRYLFLWEHEPT